MESKTFAIIASAAILLFVLDLIRRQKLTFKYSLAWLGASAVGLLFSINDGLIHKISHFAGFQLTSNFIYFLMLIFCVLLALLLTLYIDQQNTRSEYLAQKVGILESKIKELTGKK